MYSKTTFPKFDSDLTINPVDSIYTCGSCFAQEFYDKLSARKFKVIPHPFGIVFNPLSIAQQFDHLFSKYIFQQRDLVFHNGLYHSLNHHGSFSNNDPDQAVQFINSQIESAYESLKETSYLVLTLGSAWYYQWNENNKVVANCHKIPQSKFTKKRAEPNEIVNSLEQTFNTLKQINPNIQIILSISPVRYLKDGFVENARSKAALLLAADYLCKNNSFVNYFPAYEIFMDDLRDYRYVKDDLVHPNKAAIEYIWSYFESAFLSEKSKKLIAQLDRFYQLLDHRIMNVHSEDYQSYILNLKNELNQLERNNQQIDFILEHIRIKDLEESL